MSTVHDELARVIAALPEERAKQVLAYARQLTTLGAEVEYGDWTDEDRRAARINSFLRFAREHGEEDWGVDYEAMREDRPCSPPGT
jgi:hypothetical protein